MNAAQVSKDYMQGSGTGNRIAHLRRNVHVSFVGLGTHWRGREMWCIHNR